MVGKCKRSNLKIDVLRSGGSSQLAMTISPVRIDTLTLIEPDKFKD